MRRDRYVRLTAITKEEHCEAIMRVPARICLTALFSVDAEVAT